MRLIDNGSDFDLTGLTREQVGFILMASGQSKPSDRHSLARAGGSVFEVLSRRTGDFLDLSDPAVVWGTDVAIDYTAQTVEVLEPEPEFSPIFNETGPNIG